MNKRFIESNSDSVRKKRIKNLAISIVILIELIAIVTVASFAWVETVSSIKITNEANTKGTVDTYIFTDAMIGKKQGTIDLGTYFKQAGDMHFAPCSSADGKTMYFPYIDASGTGYRTSNPKAFRKGNVSDKNTGYLSITFRVKVDTNADFFFNDPVPTVDNNIRVSVTAKSEGSQEAPVTKIYANSAASTSVVNSSDGNTGATTIESFSAHKKGTGSTKRIFTVGADETKIVTVNVWYQQTTMGDSAVSVTQTLTNLSLVSSLTPRHVTLIPTPTWDLSGTTEYFYAWCWNASNGDDPQLYKLDLDANEHYAFDYNGTYQDTLFFRCGNANLKTADMGVNWNTLGLWNKTADTSIPNSPENPTYVIQTISGGAHDDDINGNKSTGSWVDPAIINFDYVTNQTTSYGTITATTYRGTSVNANDVMEASNASATLHNKTVHAWPAKKVRLTATAKSGYRFVGWYTDPAGSGTAASTSATYDFDAPSAATEVSYYAKFVKTYTFKLQRVVDGSTTSTAAAGTLTVNGSTTGNKATSKSVTVDQGSSVTFSAAAEDGYTVGIYTTQTGNTTAPSSVTLNSNITYYARFTPRNYVVTAHSRYLSGSSYTTTDSTTGGTVKVGSATAGASSSASVKYTGTVDLVASPQSGYAFVGWFLTENGTTAASTSTTYTYTLSTPGAKDVYARFRVNTFSVTAHARHSTDGSSYSSSDSTTGGNVRLSTSSTGAASASKSVTVGSSVTFVATPATGYEFVGWYNGTGSSATQLGTNTSYTYTLNSYAAANVYARFVACSWTLNYGVSGASSWNSVAASVSGNNVTASLTLTEGQDFSFQIVKTAGSTDTWYGGGGTYQNITSTSFISNKTLSAGGGDIYMKGHAGTYTFTFNKSTNVLNVTASYSNITITLNDTSSNSWIHNDGAIIYLDASGYSGILMTKTSDTTWTASIPSNTRTGQIQFKRNNSGNTETWNTFTWNSRGYGTSFNAP